MDEKTTVALISGGAAVAAAIVTGWVSKFSAREKTRQLERQHERDLHAKHLDNARRHLDDLYIPLGQAIAKFGDRFRKYQAEVDTGAGTADENQLASLQRAISDFEELLAALRAQGADVFMIPELEELLYPFASFLRESLDATTTVVRAVVRVDFGMFGISQRMERSFEVSRSMAGTVKGHVRVPGVPFGFAYEAQDILAAPVSSKDFVDHVSKSLPKLRAAIKIVSLGPRG
ncbi:MAG: hypothetical protein AAF196_07760 [Planctomycetota bacterium]